jgi:hypothetical protein
MSMRRRFKKIFLGGLVEEKNTVNIKIFLASMIIFTNSKDEGKSAQIHIF